MACSCGLSNRKTFSQIALQDGGSLPSLKYLHCKYQDQFEMLFKQIGITINESSLKLLATIADNGLDRQGTLKDPNGNPIYFSVEEVINKINKGKPMNTFCAL